jgi:hypothetical protein
VRGTGLRGDAAHGQAVEALPGDDVPGGLGDLIATGVVVDDLRHLDSRFGEGICVQRTEFHFS